MTQRQKTPSRAISPCPYSHAARYIHDLRREGEGEGEGEGHLIECRCSTTAKHPTFDLASAHWHKQYGLQPTAAAVGEWLASDVLQMKLFAAGRA